MANVILPAPTVQRRFARAIVTFDGTAGGGEAGTNVVVFSTTGAVLLIDLSVRVLTDLTESAPTATISMGSAGNVVSLRTTKNAVDFNVDEFWGPTGTLSQEIERASVHTQADHEPAYCGMDVIFAPAVTNIMSGAIVVDVWYYSITDDGLLS